MARSKKAKPTKYPGVYKLEDGKFRVRGRFVDPRTGKMKEVDRVVREKTPLRALVALDELMKEAKEETAPEGRVRVSDFAKSWMLTKKALVSKGTWSRYMAGLDQHVLPALGSYYCDQLRPHDVQRWVNAELEQGYSVRSVHGWYRTLRTMMTDAMYQLDLPRDPTARVSFPEAAEPEGDNAISVEQLGKLLAAFKQVAPQHYGIVAMLAYTGLRFTHASALRWEDIDFDEGVIHVKRSQNRGHVGPVSRRKRAPRRYPLHPELADILHWHREHLMRIQARGFEDGWCFPSATGKLRAVSSIRKAWGECCQMAGIKGRFTPHGLRRTFNDLARRAGVDAVITKSLTGHVTDRMREHYSTVGLDEKREAINNVVSLIRRDDNNEVGDPVGDHDQSPTEKEKRPRELGN